MSAATVCGAAVLLCAGPITVARSADDVTANPTTESAAGLSGFELPPGFRISEFATDALAHDIYSMTLDAQGRVVVAGAGYVKTLHDEDGDGRADRAELFSAEPKNGAHGLYFDGNDLICTGDNALARYRDRDGDGRADGPREVLADIAVRGDHSGNGVVQGPDGWLYIACGNDAGVGERHAQPGSPVAHPTQGAVLRVSPDGKQHEVVAHGFRNPYDLAFSEFGTVLLVDADGERDQYLPWYSPTRLFDVGTGLHHGWMLPGWVRSWNRPPWFFDTVPRLVEIGRGSPTGAVVYRHRQFPPRYRNAMFSACWSLGRIYCFVLRRNGPGWDCPRGAEVFLQPTGNGGFAPVDLAVGPQGEMYIAIGGRGTRGGVFRIDYVDSLTANIDVPDTAPPDSNGTGKGHAIRREAGTSGTGKGASGKGATGTGDAGHNGDESGSADDGGRGRLDRVLNAPQPLAAWSRANWQVVAEDLGRGPFEAAVLDAGRTEAERIRALEVLTELFGGLDWSAAESVVQAGTPGLKARLAWSLGRTAPLPISGRSDYFGKQRVRLLGRLSRDADPFVRRAVWEAVLDLPDAKELAGQLDWRDVYEPRPKRLRSVAVAAYATRFGDTDIDAVAARSRAGVIEARLAEMWKAHTAGEWTPDSCNAVFGLLQQARTDVQKLEAVRLLQLCLGDVLVDPQQPDVYAGYAPRVTLPEAHPFMQAAVPVLTEALRDGRSPLDWEIGRLLGMLGNATARTLERIAEFWTETSPVERDIHWLIVASRLRGPRSDTVTARTARALLRLHAKMDRAGQFPSRFWPARVGETFTELLKRDPDLATAVAADGEFGRVDHALFAARLPASQRRQAALRILDRVTDPDDWTGELVRLTRELPDDDRKRRLRSAWSNPALRDEVARELAELSDPADAPRFIEILRYGEAGTVRAVAAVLARLPARAAAADFAAAVSAMRQFATETRFASVCVELDRLLAYWSQTEPSPSGTTPAELRRRWDRWLHETYPQTAAALETATVDLDQWRRRLAALDWNAGDPERGRRVFQQRSCAKCHAGNARLGPELSGIARRFSRDDLFTAILDPNRDVSPAYRVTQIVMHSGQVIFGQVLYESPESTLVQTGPDTTVRLRGAEIASIRKTPQSPMPANLLRDATDKELADLYAWLKSLDARSSR